MGRFLLALVNQLIVLLGFMMIYNEGQSVIGFAGREKFYRYGTPSKFGSIGNPLAPQAERYYHHPGGAKIIKYSNYEIRYEIGRKIVIVCSATGKPLPHFSWYKDGIEFYHHRWVQITQWTYGDKITSKLEIHPATVQDSGQFECMAENKFAIDRRRFITQFIDHNK